MIQQNVLPFKVEMTRDLITPHVGLALLGEFTAALGLLDSADRYSPRPGSGAYQMASTPGSDRTMETVSDSR